MNFKVYKDGVLLSNEIFNFNDKKIVFIFHGLFGRAKNWHSIALKTSVLVQDYIIVFDLRNHGENPQSDQISYSLMVNDVYEFVKRSKISKFSYL